MHFGPNGGGISDGFVFKLSPVGLCKLSLAPSLGGSQNRFCPSSGSRFGAERLRGGLHVLAGFVLLPMPCGRAPAAARMAGLPKLNPSGTGFIYSTYLGGSGDEQHSGHRP